MPNDFISPTFGPGSQPTDVDGEAPDYMEMPRDMATFIPPVAPEPDDIADMEAGKRKLEDLLDILRLFKAHMPAAILDLGDLAKEDLGLVNQILGEGEVSIVCGNHIQAQEAVLPGVWRVLHFTDDGSISQDIIEVAAYPDAVRNNVFKGSQTAVPGIDASLPEGVFNAPSLLSEIADKQANYLSGDEVHSVNLTLLPHTEEDLVYLAGKLGKGKTIVLSRGYGNCRVSSTNTENVWWVQYYNSQDALILNSIEIIDVPEVVCAAQEDLEDSAERLNEILEIYR